MKFLYMLPLAVLLSACAMQESMKQKESSEQAYRQCLLKKAVAKCEGLKRIYEMDKADLDARWVGLENIGKQNEPRISCTTTGNTTNCY